jgi:hypothetical protein
MGKFSESIRKFSAPDPSDTTALAVCVPFRGVARRLLLPVT